MINPNRLQYSEVVFNRNRILEFLAFADRKNYRCSFKNAVASAKVANT